MYIFFIKWRTWKADIEKIIIVLNYFCKTLHCICFRGFWICQGFEYTRVMNHQCSEYTTILNIPRFWISFWFWICKGLIIPRFWIYQGSELQEVWICHGSEYPSDFEYARVLNISGSCIWQGYTGFWKCLNMPELFLKVPNYAWICLNMTKYAEIFMNIPNSIWIAFDLHFSIITLCLGTTDFFLEKTNFGFFCSSWKYLIWFLF